VVLGTVCSYENAFSVLKGTMSCPILGSISGLKDLAAVGTMCLRSFKYLIHIHQSNCEEFVWGFG
jgi:hypothetical protein